MGKRKKQSTEKLTAFKENTLRTEQSISGRKVRETCLVEAHGIRGASPESAVPRTFFRSLTCWSSPRSISTAKLNTSLHLHTQPIYHVVFMGPYLISQWDILSWGWLHA